MAGVVASKVRLGVIGLGRLWEGRHKPALAQLADRFRVVALYNQVARRAELAARQLDCRAMDGLTGLVESPDVDAIAWLAPQWFGAYPVELAARAGKPIYAAPPLPTDAAALDRLDALARATNLVLMPEFASFAYPAMLQLAELIRGPLGPVQTIQGRATLLAFDRAQPSRPGFIATTGSLLDDLGPTIVDWSRRLMGADVHRVEVRPTGRPSNAANEFDMMTVDLGFDGPRTTSWILRHEVVATRMNLPVQPHPEVSIQADAGKAWINRADRLRWTDGGGDARDETLAAAPPDFESLLDHFGHLVRGQETSAPTWTDALAAARVVEAMRRSLRDGEIVRLEPGAGLDLPAASSPGS